MAEGSLTGEGLWMEYLISPPEERQSCSQVGAGGDVWMGHSELISQEAECRGLKLLKRIALVRI